MPATGHRLLMVLDEFAGLRRMEVLENAAAQIAGFGVKMFFIVQTLGQLKDIYKENWQTFLANSGLHLFAQIDDEFTRKYVSDAIGETEILRRTASFNSSNSTTQGTSTGPGSMGGGRNAGMNFLAAAIPSVTSSSSSTSSTTQGWSESIHKTHLLSPSEVGRAFARIDDKSNIAYPGLSLALVSGRNPLLVHKANYYDDETFLTLFDPHPDHKPPRTLLENSQYLSDREDRNRRALQHQSSKRKNIALRLCRHARYLQLFQYITLLPLLFVPIVIASVSLFCYESCGTRQHNNGWYFSYFLITIFALSMFRRFFPRKKLMLEAASGILQRGGDKSQVMKKLIGIRRLFRSAF